MFAVVNSGGKQHKLEVGKIFKVEKIEAEIGSKVKLDDVITLGDKPLVVSKDELKSSHVVVEVVDQIRDDKVIVFKKKRRQNYRRKNGHRQSLTVLKVLDIVK